ncbi:hypothetical protein QFZ81_001011 [Paenibacillus sp. V4I9]|uniref:hypothetical protein n=1 Tax=Paenibacillus sp. V4I9 TaxID=3042308 RepID=UPI00277F5B8D|nr:hypothetical protein [Paenibacillus sp. V4I9]MDQ0885923.1 hypothetical protein [Paenibacillus sp. V4I9]
MSERLFTYAALIELLLEVRSLIDTPNTDVTWSRFKDVNEALKFLDSCIESLRLGNESALDDIMLLFAPTGSLQEIFIASGWGNEFIEISSRFDDAFSQMREI